MSTEGREQELLDWIAGDLPAERKAQVDAHLRECEECRALVRDLLNLSAGLELIGGEEAATHTNRGRMLAAAAVALILATPFGIARLRQRTEVPSVASARAAPAVQLDEVSQGLISGDEEALARHARTARSVPVRLAAFSGTPQAPAGLDADELVAAFAAETDTVVRLWLIVAIARAGNADAAGAVRDLVDIEGAAAAADVRAAVDAYLRVPNMQETS